MGKPSDYPGFKTLLKEWNQKLSDSGLKDIELNSLPSGTEGRFKRSDPLVQELKARYYDIIGQNIIETTFDDPQEKQILCFYFEGMPQTEIATRLQICRMTVYNKLHKWLRHWNLK